jgi:nickel-dependent lactate racemase
MAKSAQIHSMEPVLHYGRDSQLRLQLADSALIADCSGPRGRAIENPRLAVELALESPLDFPPLEQAVAPGDRVTVALGNDVPHAADIVRPVVEALLRRGVEPDAVTILRSQHEIERHAQDPRQALSDAVRSAVSLVVHNPADRGQLSYLAATAEGRPIYLNRALCDADLVIPVPCMQTGPGSGDYAAGIYPTFSDQETVERYRNPNLADGDNDIVERARHEANEVAWLLGVLFVIQTVPGQANDLLSVVAGHLESATRRARELYQHAWSYRVPRRASLVVASVPGDDSEQTWENVGRAVSAATQAVADDGAIAILSELRAEPGPGVRRIADFENPRQAMKHLRKERPSDVFPAVQIARALARARVYLLSGLAEELIEGLGMTPVDEAEDISRLARRHPSCIVLGNAQHTIARAEIDE